jgi:hypothetical protein
LPNKKAKLNRGSSFDGPTILLNQFIKWNKKVNANLIDVSIIFSVMDIKQPFWPIRFDVAANKYPILH